MTTPKARYEIVAAWKSAIGQANQFSSQLTRMFAPAAIGAGLFSLSKAALSSADAIGDAAEVAGVFASEMSRVKYIADQSDVSFESLQTGIKKFQKTASEAASGSKEAADAFSAIGISSDQLRGKRLDEQLGTIADRFKLIPDPADRTRIAMDLFGKSGSDLIPMLMRGSEEMAALAAEADRLGITLNDRSVAAIDRSGKALDQFWESIKGNLANGLGGFIADLRGTGDQFDDLTYKLDQLKAKQAELREGNFFQRNKAEGMSSSNGSITYIEKLLQFETEIKEKKDFQAQAAQAALQFQKENLAAIQIALAVESDRIAKSVGGENTLHEFRVTARRKELTAMEQYYERLQEMTMTNVEREGAAFTAELAALDELLKEKLIKEEVYQKRRTEIMEKYLPEQQVKLKKIVDEDEKATSEMTKHWETFSERAQGAMADFLFDPFEDGLDGMFNKFLDTMRRMAAEKAAQKIFDEVDGFDWGSIGGFISGLAGTNGGAASSGGSWSGPRAKGGPVKAGGGYLVGEEGPEFFAPSTNGFIIPNGALRNSSNNGNVTINQTYNVTGNGVTRAEVIAISEQGRKAAIAEIRDIKRRGRF